MPQVKTSDWKAWIDTMPIQPTPGGTLHVIGQVNAGGALAFLNKREPQGINPDILLLDLRVINGIVPVKNPQQVHYRQNLDKDQRYTEIQIFLEGKEEARITKIDILG